MKINFGNNGFSVTNVQSLIKPTPINNGIYQFLSQHNESSITESIVNFENLDLQNISNENLHHEIIKLFGIYTEGKYSSTLIPQVFSYYSGSEFYRIRKLINGKFEDTIKCDDDFWSPPTKFVKKFGRINEPNESILYISDNINTCLIESRIEDSEEFALITYNSLKEIKVCDIKGGKLSADRSSESETKLNLINNYLHKIFSQKITDSHDEIKYRVSNIIAKGFFDLPPVVSDGWRYPTVIGTKGYNFGFRPVISKSLLKPISVEHLQLKGDKILIIQRKMI